MILSTVHGKKWTGGDNTVHGKTGNMKIRKKLTIILRRKEKRQWRREYYAAPLLPTVCLPKQKTQEGNINTLHD